MFSGSEGFHDAVMRNLGSVSFMDLGFSTTRS